MKVALIFLCLIFSLTAAGQEVNFPRDSVTGKVDYQSIVQVPNVSKDELYIRAKEWFAKAFVSAQDVLQMDDKETGKLIGKAIAMEEYRTLFISTKNKLFYTVSITVKEGRFRYEITDFYREIISTGESGSLTTGKESLDVLINNVDNINNKGEYRGKLKRLTLFANTTALDLERSIVESLTLKSVGKSKDDF